eukprot:6284829-Alexandrium_andersonii.AAC.1
MRGMDGVYNPAMQSQRVDLTEVAQRRSTKEECCLTNTWPCWPHSAKEIMLDGRHWDPYGARWGFICHWPLAIEA